jgi:ABC-type branched-subunit amino acid transport system ATPase component
MTEPPVGAGVATANVNGADPSGQPALNCSSVTVRFGGIVALSDVSLEVAPHQIVGLMGPNGAGKSTLFDVLSGLRRPDSGRVEISGQDVTGLTAQARTRLGLYRTFQRPQLFPTLTVREHLTVAYRVRRDRSRIWTDLLCIPSRWRRDPEEERRVDELLRVLGLASVSNRRTVVLPLGLLRRVEVGRALAGDPQVILLDEPSSGLDVHETALLADAIQRARNEWGVATVLVEHDVELVLTLADRVYVLDFGIMIADGPPDVVRNDPAVQAAYIGTEEVV